MTPKRIDIAELALIGRNLTQLLRDSNMTQLELAEKLGLSESAIGKWILGKNAPSIGNVQKIAKFFGVSASDILETNIETPYSIHQKVLMDKIAKASPAKLRKFEKLMELIDDEETNNS